MPNHCDAFVIFATCYYTALNVRVKPANLFIHGNDGGQQALQFSSVQWFLEWLKW